MEKDPLVLRGYCVSKELAKDLCWSACIAFGVHDVSVTQVKGFGWLVEAECDGEWSANAVKTILGQRKTAKVNWV